MTIERLPTDMGRWVSVLVPASQLAERIADTEFVPKAMRGKPDVVTAAIMYGDELDIGPMQALAGIHVVEGRPQPSAELMRALIARAGHTFTVHEMTGIKCRISGLRAGRPEAERAVVEWTMDMARAAGLTSKQNWRAYPRAMLLARATSDLARLLFPDVIKGLGYVTEDVETAEALQAWGPAEDVPVAPPVKPRPQRKRAPSLPSPGHHLATEDKPGPDGSVDIPLPEEIPTPHLDPPPAEPEPMPDLEPEATPDEPTPEPKPLGEAPFKALQAALTKVLGRAPREDRLGAVSAIIGRSLDTSSDLTRDEGYRALGFLNRVEAGAAGLVKRAGVWEAVTYDQETGQEDPWATDEPMPGTEVEPPGHQGHDQG